LRKGPLCEGFGGEIWLDGGHNPGAGAALAETLRDWRRGDAAPRPLHLIVGMLDNKDVDNFLAPFRSLAPEIHAVPVPHETAAMAPERIVRAAIAQGFVANQAADVGSAVQAISKAEAPRVLICGTLYLAGSILATNPQDDVA
jgi:dihydrofolate synthase/folylpolyglutamate synthase